MTPEAEHFLMKAAAEVLVHGGISSLRPLRSTSKRQQLLNGAAANSFLTQTFNLFIIHVSNSARGQKLVASSPFSLPSCREDAALFSVCQARLWTQQRRATLFHLCSLSAVSLAVTSVHLCLSLLCHMELKPTRS